METLSELEQCFSGFASVPFDEQETLININYETKRASVYSSRPAVARKIFDLYKANQDEVDLIALDRYGIDVSVPMSWIVVRPKIKRNFTEKQRKEIGERLNASRVKKVSDV